MSRLQIRETDAGYDVESITNNGIITSLLALPTEDRAHSIAHMISDESKYFHFPRGSRTIPLKSTT